MINRDQFAAYLVLNECADNTVRNYSAMFVRWCDWAIAHDYDPAAPDALAVRAWSKTINGTRSSLAHARATIGHLCRALEVEDVSPAIPLPRQPHKSRAALPHDQAVALHRHALDAGLKGLAVLVVLYTTARTSEVASLAWRNIDFPNRRVTLVRDKVRDRHTITLAENLAWHLERRHVPGDLWVFPGRHGGHVAPATVWRWVLDVAADAGVGHVTPRALRHTSITEAYEATGDVLAVQNLAGHTRPETTYGYVRLSDRRARATVEALDRAYEGLGGDAA